MKLDAWVYFFMHAFRYEANNMRLAETMFLEPFLEEQTLTGSTQVEVMILTNPYRIGLFFFLDWTKPDSKITINKANWSDLDKIISQLTKKYQSLNLKRTELQALFDRCKLGPDNITHGCDFIKGVLLVYFTRDPRKKMTIIPTPLSVSKPQDVAEMIFHLNLDQASSYF